MRLDARKGDKGWRCFDSKRCCEVVHVMSVDDETATWEELDLSPKGRAFACLTGELPTITHQEERIRIHADRRLVIFNEVDDPEADAVPRETAMPAPPLRVRAVEPA